MTSHFGRDIDGLLEFKIGLRGLTGPEELQANPLALFPALGPRFLCFGLAGEVVAVKHQIRGDSEVLEHPDTVHGEVYISDGGLEGGHKRGRGLDLLAGWLALGQFKGTGYGAAMEPAIAVDAEGFPGILLEFGGAVDGFEQREKACQVTMSGRPTVIQGGGILPMMPILSPRKRTEG
jgi:hypothetical protein